MDGSFPDTVQDLIFNLVSFGLKLLILDIVCQRVFCEPVKKRLLGKSWYIKALKSDYSVALKGSQSYFLNQFLTPGDGVLHEYKDFLLKFYLTDFFVFVSVPFSLV